MTGTGRKILFNTCPQKYGMKDILGMQPMEMRLPWLLFSQQTVLAELWTIR